MTHLRAAMLLLFALPIPLRADDTIPNTLTPKEIQEGWILLFDGATTFGWSKEGEANVANGALQIGGEFKSNFFTNAEFLSFELQFEYKVEGGIEFTIAGHSFDLKAKNVDGNWIKAGVDVVDGMVTSAHTCKPSEGIGTIAAVTITTTERFKPEPHPVAITTSAGTKLTLRNVKLKPTGLKPLFNGKDLSGWKVFGDPKRNQSKWTVTAEGWLNVKNGPGDLQTERKFDDFVLQFECISNGKALNSGVFFRCVANEYQNGYEAQIQNGYKDNDRTKPSDFGTGAIYRRVPTRKVVSNDNEWFTMTVAASGKHLATWVDGYQTVDWTDERPPNNNPRNGSKTAAGHISIQGHDPTTNLSFRNIRIGELKTPEK